MVAPRNYEKRTPPRLAHLFPGQATPAYKPTGALPPPYAPRPPVLPVVSSLIFEILCVLSAFELNHLHPKPRNTRPNTYRGSPATRPTSSELHNFALHDEGPNTHENPPPRPPSYHPNPNPQTHLRPTTAPATPITNSPHCHPILTTFRPQTPHNLTTNSPQKHHTPCVTHHPPATPAAAPPPSHTNSAPRNTPRTTTTNTTPTYYSDTTPG